MRPSLVLSIILFASSAVAAPIPVSHEPRGLGSQLANSAKIAMSRILPETRLGLKQAVAHVEETFNPLATLTDEQANVLLSAADLGDAKAIAALQKAVEKLYENLGPNEPVVTSEAGNRVLTKFTVFWTDLKGPHWDITPKFEANVAHQVTTFGKQAAKVWLKNAKGSLSSSGSAVAPGGVTDVIEVIPAATYKKPADTLARALDLRNVVGSDGYNFPSELTKAHMAQLKAYANQNPGTLQALLEEIQANIPSASAAQLRELSDDVLPKRFDAHYGGGARLSS